MNKRCFIAINLPPHIKDELKIISNELQKLNKRFPIKWVNSQICHITLNFLGSIDEAMIEKVGEIVSALVKKYKAVKLKLNHLGGFPNLERPRVVFVDCKELNNNQIELLQSDLSQELGKLGLRADNRPWQPHITLARIKAPNVKLKFDDISVEPLEFEVQSIELMESSLGPDGARYGVVKSFYLC